MTSARQFMSSKRWFSEVSSREALRSASTFLGRTGRRPSGTTFCGPEHHWFEDRAPACSVLTYVDDATSRPQLLSFVEGESTFDYMLGRDVILMILDQQS